MNYRAVASTLFVLSLLPAVGCDKATPVAPSGSTLAISANPAKIDSAIGTSSIRVTALKPNGTPVNPGTEIRFATDLGSIDEVATTDSSGVARATLRGDGRIGTAKVSATTGGVAMAATIDVEIGSPPKTIVLQADPTVLTSVGGRVKLTALVRDSRGRPLAGASVNFLTELGRLDSGGRILQTDANGQVIDRLNVSESEIAATQTTGFSVTAQTADGTGALIERSFRIDVQSDRPIANFTVSGSNSLVKFTNTTTGKEPITFTWDFGDPSHPDPTQEDLRNPQHDYVVDNGTFTVQLTAENDSGSDVVQKQIKLTNGVPSIVSGGSR